METTVSHKTHLHPHALSALLIALLLVASGFLTDSTAADRPWRASVTDLSLEQLMEVEVETVYGASGHTQRVTEAPSSVSIITQSDIRRYGYRTLADILRSVRGFYISNDRTYQYAGSRGFSRPGDYNTRLLLLVDGHRMNDSIYNTAAIGNDFILDVDLIDRVEVIRGPGSALYGNNAFFGVINVITKRAVAYNGFEVSGAAASYDTYKERATYGKQYANGLEMLVSGSYARSRGQSLYFREFDAASTNHGRADSGDYEKSGNVFADVRYRDLDVRAAYMSRNKGIPTASYGTVFNDNNTEVTGQRAYLDVKYRKEIDATTNVGARLFYDYGRYNGTYMFDYPPVTANRDLAEGKWWGGQVEAAKRLFDRHAVMIGIEYEDFYSQRQRNYDRNPYASYLNDSRGSYVWAARIQDEFSILDNLVLNAGVRYDYYKTFGSTTNPRAGLIYRPFSGTSLKLLYGQAFRAPNAYELFYHDGGITQKPNPDLRPETIKTYEMIVEQYVKNYRFSLSGYRYTIDNLITLTQDPADGLRVFRNVGEIDAEGVEFEVEAKWRSGIEGRASYALQQAEDRGSGRSLTNSPKNLGKLNVHVPIYRGLSTGIELQYTGPRRDLQGGNAGGYTVANVTLLAREIVRNLEISGTVYNLFDKRYGDPVSSEHLQPVIIQDGTAYRLKLTYRF
jgi:iron complex outermembrane receptor protein